MGADDVCIGAAHDCGAIDGRAGVAVLVPYYHGRQACNAAGTVTKHIVTADTPCAPVARGMRDNAAFYGSKLVRVDLQTSKYSTVKIHGLKTDFSDYYTYYWGTRTGDPQSASLRYRGQPGLAYQLGIGAYAGQLVVSDVWRPSSGTRRCAGSSTGSWPTTPGATGRGTRT
jgi:hypothetical protein